MKKRIDATIYLGNYEKRSTCVWVDENATEQEIQESLNEEALDMIGISWKDSGIRAE